MPKFKTYQQNQSYLLPLSPADCLPQNHICFAINNIIDSLDLGPIEKTHSNIGASAYLPSALIKVLFLAYIQGIRSSRKIETKLYQDIAFRFLAGNVTPDHGTINIFRKSHLSNLEDVFAQMIILADGMGIVDLADISLDGTKIKANAGKNNAVDLKQIKDYKEYFKKTMQEADGIDKEEDKKFGNSCGCGAMPSHLVDPKQRQKALENAKKKLEKSRKRKTESRKNRNLRKAKRINNSEGTALQISPIRMPTC